MTPACYFIFLSLTCVLADKKSDVIHTHIPNDSKDVVVTQIKEIPLSELVPVQALPFEDTHRGGLSEKLDDKHPQIVVIKPLDQPDKAQPTKVNKAQKKTKKNWSKLRKIKRKQNRKDERKSRKIIKKQIKKHLKNQRKQMSKNPMKKTNKWRGKAKKQMRNLESEKFTGLIEKIMSYHKTGKGSEVSTKYIQDQVMKLMNDPKTPKKLVGQTSKDCPKPKRNKNKRRKLMRSFFRGKKGKGRVNKPRVVTKGSKKVSITKGNKHGAKVTKTIVKPIKPKIWRGRGGKGQIKASVRVERKKGPKKGRKVIRKNVKKNNLNKVKNIS